MLKSFLFILFFFTSAFSQIELREKIDKILNELPEGTKSGIIIINPQTLDTLYQKDIKLPLIPASNTKLFSTAVALDLFGPDFKVSTKLLTDAKKTKGYMLDGNIYIKGYGNPTFSEKDMEKFAEELKNRGIRLITGNIIGDESYFDDIYTREGGIEEERASVKLPPISALIYKRNQIVTKRKVRRRIKYQTINVSEPAVHVAREFKTKLKEYGIIVDGNCLSSVTPDNAIEITSSYIKLLDMISIINKRSDNYYAECLFKIIGAEVNGLPGNGMLSSQTIISYMKDRDIYLGKCQIVDGSGISRYNQASAATIASLLENVYLDVKLFDLYNKSLSIAGYDGTLGYRMSGTSAEYNFKGKTGTLNGVSSLSGFLKLQNGDDIIVSILFEFDSKGGRYFRNIQDKIIEAVTESF